MVKRHTHRDAKLWLAHFATQRGDKDLALLQTAIVLFAEQALPTLEKSLGIANILLELGLDNEGIAAAIAYPALQVHDIQLDTITDQLGESAARLLRDVLQMRSLDKLQQLGQRGSHQLENIRKMLLAMVADVRAVLVILAERLWLLRYAKNSPKSEQQILAQQSLSIYAPLANRLGVGHLKWEMEDLCLRYLQPEVYKEIVQWLASRRDEREQYILHVINTLTTMLNDADIKNVEVMGRVKHIYSIYRKMQRKGSALNEIYDISAVRVLVNEIADCYAVLGLVHGAWQQVPKEFDDYIIHPKPNGYRSIHTAVIGPEDRVVEVQIRTYQMHQESELGVAAHWRYKEGGVQPSSYEAKIAWLRQVMEWQKEITSGSEKDPQTQPTPDLFADRVYVFTPTGDIIDLPQGATPLDFAYHIHSEVGHRCRGAKVNGNIVPLTYQLQMGEKIEILTAKHAHPSRDWISPHAGYLKTARARAKVSHWFKVLDESTQTSSREPVEKEIKHSDVTSTIVERPKAKKAPQDIQILGVGNLLTQIARCCKPLPGDPIVGFITQGRGINVHRQDCTNILNVTEKSRQRIIDVSWGEKTSTYPVDLHLQVYNRDGLLRDITNLLSSEKINVVGLQTISQKDSLEADIHLTIEITGVTQLQKTLERLKQVPNIIRANRRNI
jgi:GTP pyrophosphokinase